MGPAGQKAGHKSAVCACTLSPNNFVILSSCLFIFKNQIVISMDARKKEHNLCYLQAFSMKPSIFTTRTSQHTVQWEMFNQIQAYCTLRRFSRFFIRKDLNWLMFPTVRSTNDNTRFPHQKNILRTFFIKTEDSKMNFLPHLLFTNKYTIR